MRIIWQDKAESDLDQIAAYMMEDDSAAALRVVSTIRDAARVLIDYPKIGRAGRVEGTRELVVSGLPFAHDRLAPASSRFPMVGHGAPCPTRAPFRIRQMMYVQ